MLTAHCARHHGGRGCPLLFEAQLFSRFQQIQDVGLKLLVLENDGLLDIPEERVGVDADSFSAGLLLYGCVARLRLLLSHE